MATAQPAGHVQAQRHQLRVMLGMTSAHEAPSKHPDEKIDAARRAHFAEMTRVLDSQETLVDRHIATVRAETDEERRQAATKIAGGDMIESEPYSSLLARMLARVEAEIRAHRENLVAPDVVL